MGTPGRRIVSGKRHEPPHRSAPEEMSAQQQPIAPRHSHLAAESGVALRETRRLAAGYKGFNAKTAIIVPAVLGSMPFFWFCCLLAVCSLPAVLTAFDTEVLKRAIGLASFFPSVIVKVSLIALVAWLAQTFIQLVALPVLQVSNNAQMAQQEEHTAAILRGVEHAEDLLDLHTAGGLRELRDYLDARLDTLASGGAPGRASPPPGS
jgi:hypothetical protein